MNPEDEGRGWRIFVGLVAAVGGLSTVGWALWHLVPTTGTNFDRWQTLGMLVVTVGIAFGVAAMLRYALAPLIPRHAAVAAPAEADNNMRGRIAPIVLSIGSLAIVLLAGILIVSFVAMWMKDPTAPVSAKVDTLLTGIFTAVLPVVATWVGTVLAFYFGSENFRQAAQQTREVLTDRLAPKQKIADVMVPFERIGRLDADNADDAKKIKMESVIHMMSEAARRVIVFDKAQQCPIFVIRSAVPPMPPGWIKGDFTMGDDLKPTGKDKDATIDTYLQVENKGRKNDDDAKNFKFIAEDATPEDALALMARERVDDLFVTKDGKPGRVLGWATSHDLIGK